MIILEGVDKAGKSYLADQLSREFGFPIKKFGIPKGNPIPGYIEELNNGEVHPVIYDRFIYGEIPYSIVKKRTRFMRYLELKVLDLMVQSRPHLVIYVRPTRNTIIQRLNTLGDDYIGQGEAIALYEEYDNVMENITSNCIIYDGSEKGYQQVISAVIEIIVHPKRWLERKEWLGYKHAGIGTLTPKYLFVADKYNENARYQVTLCSASGEFLFRCLEEVGIPTRFCHFTNALQDGNKINNGLLDILNPQKIICLGMAALSSINGIAYPKTSLPHPAYWRRFHSNNVDGYIDMLEAVK